jgi:hypothetical protein
MISNGQRRPREPDFSVINQHGSVVILRYETDAARAWVDEHLPADAMTLGRNGIVIEPRYLAAILKGIVNDGLIVRV